MNGCDYMSMVNAFTGEYYQANNSSSNSNVSGNSSSGISEGLAKSIETELEGELRSIEGYIRQNPDTGGTGSGSFLKNYRNVLFGSPYQFLPSVDARFSNINSEVGSEYLRNFMLNSAILSIRPGMPHYTGGSQDNYAKDFFTSMRNGNNFFGAAWDSIMQNSIFGAGSKFQKRLYTFRETYNEYTQYANYMCRIMAIFLGLTENSNKALDTYGTYPTTIRMSNNGDPTNEERLDSAHWENYRMISGQNVLSNVDYLASILGLSNSSQLVTYSNGNSKASFNIQVGGETKSIPVSGIDVMGILGDPSSNGELVQKAGLIRDNREGSIDSLVSKLNGINWEPLRTGGGVSAINNKIKSVQFMVEPISVSEGLTNETGKSLLAVPIEGMDTIGQEVAFIKNSQADIGIIGNLVDFLGNGTTAIMDSINKLAGSTATGFVSDLFHGALGSIKGQKMIYPEIYKSSSANMEYQFSVNLVSPYGDIYDYFVNIIVPLMHLIALAAPRMLTSNSISSPFLVQAFIPGMCTCNLGIISDMRITKNQSGQHVSVNGYPLDVKVEFSIRELYRNISISPANNPASFLFNETLNDYMCNMAGLIPSIDIYDVAHSAMVEQASNYFTSGNWVNDAAGLITEKIEDLMTPY